MRTSLFCLLLAFCIAAKAQTVTAVSPNQGYQGQSLSTSISSSGLFLTGSSPQGNIQDIILNNGATSVYAISDSTNVVSSNTATTFWNLPGNLATGLYSLVVRIYDNLFTGSTTDYTLNNAFTVTSAAATVSGTIYNDLNHNGVKDAGETGMAGYTVRIKPQGNSAVSDANGNYTVSTLPGLDTLTVQQPLDDIYGAPLPASYILTVPNGATTGKDFGLTLSRYLVSMTPDSATVGQSFTAAIVSSKVFQNELITNISLRLHGSNNLIYGSSSAATDSNNAASHFSIPVTAYVGRYDLVVVVKSLLNNQSRTFTLDTAITITGPLGLISGYIYTDSNSNSTKDAGEAGVRGQYVLAQGSGYSQSVLTDSTGFYEFHTLPLGTYTISTQSPISYYSSCAASTYTTTSSFSQAVNQDTFKNKNIGVNGAQTVAAYDLFIHPGWTQANPGFERHYWIFYGNNGNNSVAGGVITFQYDSTLIFDSCDRTPSTHNLATHTLTWNVGNVDPTPLGPWATGVGAWYGGWYNFNLYMKVPVSDGAGKLLTSIFNIAPSANDCYPYNNSVTDVSPVTSSMDPNEKHANPYGDLIAAKDSIVEYTINFQNTGTASTHFVIVRDTLDAHLDYKTAIATGGSAPFKFDNNQGALTFTFDPLVITDSATDEKHSHGFVSFMVKVLPGLQIGTTIRNTASIYFDYNSAVATNTATNVIATPLSLRNMNETMKVAVRPNPFEDNAILSFNNPAHDKYELKLYDLTGNVVETLSGSGAEFMIEKKNLSAGVYMYKLTNQNTKLSAQGKISVM